MIKIKRESVDLSIFYLDVTSHGSAISPAQYVYMLHAKTFSDDL